MFTGLIREIGTLRSVGSGGRVTRLRLHAPRTAPDLGPGDSLAVNGICLTVTRKSGATVFLDAAAETRRLTTLADWRTGDRVHLEPALKAGQGLDGHLVQGHVDGTGRVLARRRSGDSLYLTVGLEAALARWLTSKGSVAVDGVSLTVDAGPFSDRFTVNLIPHTLAGTLFDRMRTGRRVNLEMDVMVKAARGAEPAAGYEPDAAQPARTLADLWARGFRRRRD